MTESRKPKTAKPRKRQHSRVVRGTGEEEQCAQSPVVVPAYRYGVVNERLDHVLTTLFARCADLQAAEFRELLITKLAGKVVFMDQEHYDGLCRLIRKAYGHR